MEHLFRPAELISYAKQLFEAIGMNQEMASITALRLVQGDMMGHTTHGLALCAPYLDQIERGDMRKEGEIELVADGGATQVWDAHYLPGLWVVHKGIEEGLRCVKKYGTYTLSIRKSTHIACLQTLLTQATDKGCMIILASSDPHVQGVAPYGGVESLFTPNPIAFGIPTENDPILIDISASITTHGFTNRMRNEGKKMPGKWLLDADGKVTDDPNSFAADPAGTILPIGGTEYGHKGFALALAIEAMTQALSGFGRVDNPNQWGASLFLQLIDPDAFTGRSQFGRIMGGLAEMCRNSKPLDPSQPVRMPGEAGLKRMREAEKHGLRLHTGIMESMSVWAKKFGIETPVPIP